MKEKLSVVGIMFAIIFFGASLIVEGISYFNKENQIPPTIMGEIFFILGLISIIIGITIGKSNKLI